jgi:hypothetical protein
VLGLAVRPEGALVRFDHPRRGPLPVRVELKARLTALERALEEERRTRAALEQELRALRGR